MTNFILTDKNSRTFSDRHLKVHAYGDMQCEVCQYVWFTKASLGTFFGIIKTFLLILCLLLEFHYRRSHPDHHVTREDRSQYQCEICKLPCYDATRLSKMKISLILL